MVLVRKVEMGPEPTTLVDNLANGFRTGLIATLNLVLFTTLRWPVEYG